MTDKMSLEAAMKIVKSHGMTVTAPEVHLKKEEVARVNEALHRNGGRVFITHTGKRMKLYTIAGYKAMCESVAKARLGRKPAQAEAPGA